MILAQLITTIDLPASQFFLLTRFTDDPGGSKGQAWSIAINHQDNDLYSLKFVAPETPVNDLKPEMTIPLWRGTNYVGHAKIVNIL